MPCTALVDISYSDAMLNLNQSVLRLEQAADLEFVVVRQPVRGHLVLHRNDTQLPLIRFDMDDLTTGSVTYDHERVSPRATIDAFSIVACLSTRRKRSQPRTVHVAIAARNVQPPYLTNHRVLRVNIGIQQTS